MDYVVLTLVTAGIAIIAKKSPGEENRIEMKTIYQLASCEMTAGIRESILNKLADLANNKTMWNYSISRFVENANDKTDAEIIRAVEHIQSQIAGKKELMKEVLGKHFHYFKNIRLKTSYS